MFFYQLVLHGFGLIFICFVFTLTHPVPKDAALETNHVERPVPITQALSNESATTPPPKTEKSPMLSNESTTTPAPKTEKSPTLSNESTTTPATKSEKSPTLSKNVDILKLLENGIFNSFLCGAGYFYDQKTTRCVIPFWKQKSTLVVEQRNKAVNEDSSKESLENSTESSLESLDYSNEKLTKAGEHMDEFFPLECGINYRYLTKKRICKPVNAVKSSESEENAKLRSSESDEN